jgi:hypothetical protein
MIQSDRIPRGELFERATDDPAAERHDQPDLLAQRNERVGTDRAELAIGPAQQRFDADRPLVAVDDRLIVEDELFAFVGDRPRARA